jgi:hypothetical protein
LTNRLLRGLLWLVDLDLELFGLQQAGRDHVRPVGRELQVDARSL